MFEIPSAVHFVLDTLSANGHLPHLVGGCVRDMLRGVEPGDYDVTSAARPEKVMALFGEHAHPTGIAHGTVSVAMDGCTVEVTTMRCDGVYRDGRHPESVSFTKDIVQDLARRDFTVNAMALTPDGTLIDPYGGREDLARGVLRCVGEAERRFSEDALRILRLLRFSSVLSFAVEENTAQAARKLRDKLKLVAHERVFVELNKLLLGRDVQRVLLDYPTILGVVLPEILPCVGFDQKNPHHCFDVWGHTARAVGAVPPTRVLRWTMLFHDLGKPDCFTLDDAGVGHYYDHTLRSAEIAREIMARLHFERALRRGVERQLACFDDFIPVERAQLHRAMARLGADTVGNLLRTKIADNAAKAPAGLSRAQAPWLELLSLWEDLMREGACCKVNDLAISGETLREIGFSGHAIGAVLDKLLFEVAGEKLKNEEEELCRRAKRLYRSGYTGKE